MSFIERLPEKTDGLKPLAGAGEGEAGESMDQVLEQALKNFRLSVHAWSDAMYSRPRTVAQVVRHRSWRLVAGWALASVLVVGGVSAGIQARHHRQEVAKIAAAQLAAQQQVSREQQAKADEEDLLAAVDSDVSREVPSAMEPLAQLMDDGAK
jgi:hypothetical protein